MKTNDIRQKNESPPARRADPADVESIDAIVTAAYDGISGPAGKKRDWDRERSLYFPGARLIPISMKAGGPPSTDSGVAGENIDPSTALRTSLAPQILDIDGFIARVEPFFKENGFYEKEIARRTEQFGKHRPCLEHLCLSRRTPRRRESRHNDDDPEPFMRGFNSIQLFNDGKRWWIVNIYWQQAFGSLFKELASTAEIISRSGNRK